jgi:general nucleoside transport system permease protein
MTEILLAFWDGAFGSAFAFWSATLVRATPLLFVGLAVALAFRAGVLNIGAEGQLLLGAIGASVVALQMPSLPRALLLPLMLLAGMAGGALWAGIAALLRRRFGVLEVISTIMLNFVALALLGWIVRGPLQEPTKVYPMSSPFAEAAHWPFLIPGQRLHLGFALGLGAAATLWYVLARTALGFRIRAIGLGARAAISAGGVNADALSARVFVVSGALAGLAGASEVGGVTWALYEGLSPGYGCTAIAVALLARLDPRWVVVTAIFFGALEAGGASVQREAGVPAVAVQIITATVLLGVLALGRWQQVRAARTATEGA